MAKENANVAKNKNKKPNWFRRVGAKIKETFSELKRVTWPTLPTVLKTTGVVLVVVFAFLVVITGIDSLLGWLLGLLSQS
jgi:preprotein translocase subunit SecE